jgi:hypothetical protein
MLWLMGYEGVTVWVMVGNPCEPTWELEKNMAYVRVWVFGGMV